jgi:hypothetical protein
MSEEEFKDFKKMLDPENPHNKSQIEDIKRRLGIVGEFELNYVNIKAYFDLLKQESKQ